MKYSGDKLQTNKDMPQAAVKHEAEERILTYIGYLYMQEIPRHKHKVFERGVRATTRQIAEACNMRQATVVQKLNDFSDQDVIELTYAGGKPQNGSIIRFKNVSYIIEDMPEKVYFSPYDVPNGREVKIYST